MTRLDEIALMLETARENVYTAKDLWRHGKVTVSAHDPQAPDIVLCEDDLPWLLADAVTAIDRAAAEIADMRKETLR